MQYTCSQAVCVYGMNLCVVSLKDVAVFDIKCFLFFPISGKHLVSVLLGTISNFKIMLHQIQLTAPQNMAKELAENYPIPSKKKKKKYIYTPNFKENLLANWENNFGGKSMCNFNINTIS